MGFRNLVIHGYGKIDDRRMLQIMRNDLSDILEFLKAVEHILNLEEASHVRKLSSYTDPLERKGISFPKNDKEKIIARLKKYLVSRPEIRFAFLHGSFLEDDLPCRDIDLAVYFDEKISDDRTFDLTLETAAELSRLLGIPVDVHPLNSASNSFCYYATRGLLLVSRNEEEVYDFMEKPGCITRTFSRCPGRFYATCWRLKSTFRPGLARPAVKHPRRRKNTRPPAPLNTPARR